MISLTKTQYQEIVDFALKTLPNEACGLLGGRVAEGNKIVERVYLMTNTDHSPEHFSMDPQEQFSTVKEMRKNGWVLLGNFHSHPESPARPSDEDKRLAIDPQASYLILSLLVQEEAVLKSFRIIGNVLQQEEIVISEEE